MSDWGKGVINNIGWGQGANNDIGWGSIYDKSNAGETLLSSGGGIDPQAQAQITRIQNAGGTIEDVNVIDADIKFLKSIGLFGNLKYAVDPRAGITQRVDGSDIFASKIFDYSGSDADTANVTGSAQPKKGILNGVTSLDFDGVDDNLTNENTVTFLAGEEMFSVAVYAQDFVNSNTFGMVVDKYLPDMDGRDFGKDRSGIRVYQDGIGGSNTPYQNVQIIVSGTIDTNGLTKGFINGDKLTVEKTLSHDAIGKTLGNIRGGRFDTRFAKVQFQKNWDFNALPTESQRNAINTYLINQFNIPV
jgi:hypothetical protein